MVALTQGWCEIGQPLPDWGCESIGNNICGSPFLLCTSPISMAHSQNNGHTRVEKHHAKREATKSTSTCTGSNRDWVLH